MLWMIRLSGGLGIAFLLTYGVTRQKGYALGGQILLIICFGLISFALFRGGAFWTAPAFAFASIAQIYALAATRIRRLRAPRTPQD